MLRVVPMWDQPFLCHPAPDAIARASPLPPTDVSPETAYFLLGEYLRGARTHFP